MQPIKDAIMLTLESGPKSISELVEALPDEQISRIGKALVALSKEGSINVAPGFVISAAVNQG